MATIFDWSTTPASNTTVDGININTGMRAVNVDNAFRSTLAAIRNSFSSTLQTFLNGTAALGVTSGGTGAVDATSARSALGAASSGANGDITGLTGVTGAFGYGAGAGAQVAQLTDKGTAVTINARCGRITLFGSALGALAATAFTVVNSTIAITDTVIINVQSGAASPGAYRVEVCNIGNGFFDVVIQNTTGGSLADAVVLNFAIIKAVVA